MKSVISLLASTEDHAQADRRTLADSLGTSNVLGGDDLKSKLGCLPAQSILGAADGLLFRFVKDSRVFRGKFVDGLRNAFHRGELQFHGSLLPLAQPRAFAAWLRVLFHHDWVVYSKRPFGGPEHVLRYLGAYIHRVAISNSRLVALSQGNVTFRWRDSAHGNKKRLMTLAVEEFLRRFLLHVLPPGFVRIRNFGFLANRNRATLLPLCFQLLSGSEQIAPSTASPSTGKTHSLWNCPVCGGTMRVVERLSAAQLLLRSPPQPDRCAA
jgi:hypothetical protein